MITKEFLFNQYSDIKTGGLPALFHKLMRVKYLAFRTINMPLYRLAAFPLKLFRLAAPNAYLEAVTKDVATLIIRHRSVNKAGQYQSKTIRIYTCVWGGHLNLYDVVLMRSLFQKGNIPELLALGYKVRLTVHTLDSDIPIVNGIIEKHARSIPIEYRNLLELDLIQYPDTYLVKALALKDTIKKCIDESSTFIMAPSDTFFGDFSLSNIVRMNMGRNLCIAAVHLRVNDSEFLSRLREVKGEISNAQLVALTMQSAHQNLKDSFIEKVNCARNSGLSSQRISDCSFAVTARLPTVHLANFNRNDLAFFQNNGGNSWDHIWPTRLMVDGRYKVIGASDVFFMAETTEPNTHLCATNGEVGDDDFQGYDFHGHGIALHKEIGRNFWVMVTSATPIDSEYYQAT